MTMRSRAWYKSPAEQDRGRQGRRFTVTLFAGLSDLRFGVLVDSHPSERSLTVQIPGLALEVWWRR